MITSQMIPIMTEEVKAKTPTTVAKVASSVFWFCEPARQQKLRHIWLPKQNFLKTYFFMSDTCWQHNLCLSAPSPLSVIAHAFGIGVSPNYKC